MQRKHIIVTGIVQGVGFRRLTAHRAKLKGISGWVRNLPDNSVELEAEGNEEALRGFIQWLNYGVEHSRVDSIIAEDVPILKETGFIIR